MKPITTSMSEPKTFQVTSGALRVTDPCYDLHVWCSGQMEGVCNGKWFAKVGYYKDPLDASWMERYFSEERRRVEDEYSTLVEPMARLKELMPEEAERLEKSATRLRDHQLQRLAEREEKSRKHPGRVSVIGIAHESVAFDDLGKFDWQHITELDVGVDSGQAGFFDLAAYTEAYSKPEKRDEFYSQVCGLTLSEEHWGVTPFGAVSSSGYGDGGYNCYVVRRATPNSDVAEIVAACIVFIDASEEEDDSEEQAECSSPS